MPLIIAIIVIIIIVKVISKRKYEELEKEILQKLGFSSWNMVTYFDEYVAVKSRQALEKYDDVKFFKENKGKLTRAEEIIKKKNNIVDILKKFLEDNEYKSRPKYRQITRQIDVVLRNASAYRIKVQYISSAGNHLGEKVITLQQSSINKFKKDPSLLMGKGEYNKYLKEQQKEALSKKQHEYYEKVNSIIDYANKNRDMLVIKGSQEKVDNLVIQLFDKTVNSIKKIKTIDSEEWTVIGDFIIHHKRELEKFNEYINEKIQSISKLFGTRVVRNETINDDEYDYIRPYKKTITPFTAEVSATVFASAENNPLEYIVKNFYPNKKSYPEQIRKLYILIEELETLRDAKQIIENYKADYQQYLGDVPAFIMENDEAGFYSRLGFANIDESVLTVEYKFSYTSNGGMARRSFIVPMTEETIIELIKLLESKLTASAFAKEQRTLMTKKLREFIKKRDNYTCCNCGNSIYAEPNLLLEIDHIIPVSKGGCTEEKNLQTLCWKCNRSKSDKIIS